VTNPRVPAIGTANPPHRFTQEEIYRLAGYQSGHILEIFLNSDIDYRHLYIDPENFSRDETPDQLNARFLRGALEIGCLATRWCLNAARLSPRDVDLFLVCTCTGYVCPDVGSRLIGHLQFRKDVQRAPLIGPGCAGAVPTLQRAWDYARAHPGRRALMLAVEICSASYYIDSSLETVVGNAICADGAAALILSTESGEGGAPLPAVVDVQSFLDTDQQDKVGFGQREGKLRIILHASIRDLAAGMIERAIDPLLGRNRLAREDIRFWATHPGGAQGHRQRAEATGIDGRTASVFAELPQEFRKHVVPDGTLRLERSGAGRRAARGGLGCDGGAGSRHGRRGRPAQMVISKDWCQFGSYRVEERI